MPLFECTQCHCVDNTAMGNYWERKLDGKPALCTECDTGEWHGQFPKRPAAGMLIDQNGHLWGSNESMPKHYKIAGKVGDSES